jgi:thiol-disulfide isomerase/thioredoxin
VRALLTLLLLVGAAHAQPFVGSPAPDLNLIGTDGKTLALNELAGRVAVVDFFATWCGPCHEAMAALDTIARKDPRIQLVVVDVGEPASTVRAFFATHALPPGARVVLDPDAAASRRWGQRRFPTTFFVDAHGVIRHINRGYGPGYADRAAKWLADMQK